MHIGTVPPTLFGRSSSSISYTRCWEDWVMPVSYLWNVRCDRVWTTWWKICHSEFKTWIELRFGHLDTGGGRAVIPKSELRFWSEISRNELPRSLQTKTNFAPQVILWMTSNRYTYLDACGCKFQLEVAHCPASRSSSEGISQNLCTDCYL